MPPPSTYTHSHTALASSAQAVREKADLAVLGSVGAPMAGTIIEVAVKPGSVVKAGQMLVVMNAMKMETSVSAPVSGTITQVAVEKNDTLDAGDLVVYIDTSASNSMDVMDSDSDEDAKDLAAAAASAATAPNQ